MSRLEMKISRWLEAFYEQNVNLTTLPGNAVLADVNGNGNYNLVITDLKLERNRSKMKVYKGTSSTEIPLPDIPNSLITFYTDELEPRIPAIAVACGCCLFIHKNNKPYYKFQVPPSLALNEETEAWKRILEVKDNVTDQEIDVLLRELSELPFGSLSNKSQEILTLNKARVPDILKALTLNDICKVHPITCTSTLKKHASGKDEIACPVVATEAGNVFIIDPETFTILHQANVERMKITPYSMKSAGVFNVDFRIVIACREGYICVLKRNWLEGKAIIQTNHNIVDFLITPEDNFIVVATTDSTLSCFTKRGQKLWSLKLKETITCLCLVEIEHIRVTLYGVGLENGLIQLYQGRTVVDQTALPDPPSVLLFGPLGQEEHVLVIVTKGLPKVLLVVGGQAPKAIRSVESYDFKEERWYQIAELPTRRCRAGLAVLGGKVYAVGGFNGSLRVKTVDVYDPTVDLWTSWESMEARRSTLGVAVLNNCIYAVGGFDGSTGLNSAEMFDPQTGKWRLIASMSTRRSSVGVGVLYGQLYAVGGYDGASRQCLSSVECYTPEADTWTSVPDMCCRRSGAGVAGTVIFRILKRTADFNLNCTDNVPQFQTKPLPLPKRSKLFLEQSLRERESALDIHQNFQKSLLKLRLDVARSLLQYKSNENEIATFKGQLKLSAQILGIGTKFTLIFTLENLESAKSINGISMILHVKPDNYICSKRRVLIPLLIPLASYKTKIGVQEITNEGELHASKLGQPCLIRIFIINEEEKLQSQPLLAATVTMPCSDSGLV